MLCPEVMATEIWDQIQYYQYNTVEEDFNKVFPNKNLQ
jgi:hypothetical protein